MKDLNNIEELFRESLGSFEADPGAGSWNAIQQGINNPAATSGSAAAGATKISLFKLVAGVAIVSTGIGLTAGYFYSEKKHQNKEENKEVVQNEEPKTIIENTNTTVQNEVVEEPVLIKESDLQQENVIVKDEKKKKNIIVTVKETPNYSKHKSSVDSWITPNNGNYTTTNNNSTNNTVNNTNSNNTSTAVNVVVVEKDESLPIASIKRSVAGGPAPLTVTFTNSSEEDAYEWRNDDFDEVVKTPSLTHTFSTPGTYTVTLTTKNKSGKKSTDEVTIEVGESIKQEEAPKMKVETYGVNVFSPNGDNTNDYFYFECANVESFFIQVIDIKGQVYFESHDPNFKWDGTTLTGEKITDGTYYYFYKAVGFDKKVLKDTRTLDIKTKR